MSNNIFIDLTEELANKGWTVHWEFNGGAIDPLLKYNDCVSYLNCRAINPDVATDVDENSGAWNYRLDNLETGGVFDLESFTLDGLFTIDSSSDLTPNASLVSFNVDLPNLTDGSGMFAGCALTSFSSALPKLSNGAGMFLGCPLTTFDSALPKLSNSDAMFAYCPFTSWDTPLPALTNGTNMFTGCENLTSFTSDLTKLDDGSEMFSGCSNLMEWNTPLPALTDGERMFGNCSNLTSFSGDLPKLTDGYMMFGNCENLTSFSGDLPNLEIVGYGGRGMFEGCTNLTSFSGDLPKLTDGAWMFYNCTNLTSFDSDLSKLASGWWMFLNCKLDTSSVKNIASTINDLSDDTNDGTYGWGEIFIGIGNTTPNAEEEAAFNTMVSKGWTVFVNGFFTSNIWTPTASTNLTEGEEQPAPIPFYAKPVQVTEEHAEYVDANNNYYNIVGGQFIYGDDLSTYGQFTSYEHAVEEISLSLGLTKYTKPTESIKKK